MSSREYKCELCGVVSCLKHTEMDRCNNEKCPILPDYMTVVSPIPDNSHYKIGAIDPCQYVEAMGTAEFRGACVLNILKYITRYPYKGTPLMDLAKAQDYLSKLIEHEKAKDQ